MTGEYTEDTLVQQTTAEYSEHQLGWESAFEQNFSDYKDTIPHLFHHNAIVMFGNGEKAKIGSVERMILHYINPRSALAPTEFTRWSGDSSLGRASIAGIMRSTEQARRGRKLTFRCSAKSCAPPSKLGGGLPNIITQRRGG